MTVGRLKELLSRISDDEEVLIGNQYFETVPVEDCYEEKDDEDPDGNPVRPYAYIEGRW